MRKISVLSVISIIVAWTTMAWTLPILNDDGTGPLDTFANGTSYGTYTNSGNLLFIESGNNLGNPANRAWVESLVENSLSLSSDFELHATNVSLTPFDSGLTGTWATDNSADVLSFYAVKAGNAFAIYQVTPADSMGSWSTFDLWLSGLANNGADLAISHYTGYNPSAAPVPEPATIILLGTGLVGLFGLGRKKIINN
jgi:hypothetical protein